ncbi:hypothetical protein BJ165DRAFT_1532364 [Panaeolus papilionaceus]|nr:hypothetical protein BJ165DRAFT_1532364 [Panaeolus papilionaceus]
MRFPLEIFEAIFEFIADDPYRFDVETLKACNLTSSTISAVCERYLYSCLYLYSKPILPEESGRYQQPDPYYPQCRMRFNNYTCILSKKPNVIRHVRRLGIIILHQRLPVGGSWLESIGQLINNINHHKIQWFKFYSNPTGLQLDAETRSSIVKVLKSPALEVLHLYGADQNIPMHHLFMQKCCALKRLDIAHSSIPPYFTFPPSESVISISLDSFTQRSNALNTPGGLIQLRTPKGNPCIDLSSLSSLSFYLSSVVILKKNDTLCLRNLLARTNNLRTLTLHTANYYFDVTASSKELASAIEKHHEMLETLVLIWKPNHAALFDSLTEFLQFSRSFNLLAQIQLQIFLPTDIDTGSPWREMEWTQIATVLSDEVIFPKLRKVGISVAPHHPTTLSDGVSKYMLAGGKVVEDQLETRGASTRLEFAANYCVSYSQVWL